MATMKELIQKSKKEAAGYAQSSDDTSSEALLESLLDLTTHSQDITDVAWLLNKVTESVYRTNANRF